jgi:hypothetical protein
VILCKHGKAEEALQRMRAIMGKLKLTMNEEKTQICTVPAGEFNFLGYTFGRMYSARTGQARLGYRPSKKSIRRMVEKIHALTAEATAWKETTTLIARAALGQILASEATFRAAHDYIDAKPLGAHELKGKAQSVVLYDVQRARTPTATRKERFVQVSAPIVGRDDELSSFRGLFASLQVGHGGIVLLLGEPGMGKSRLLAELRASAEAKAVRWLEGGALAFGRTLSYWPFLEILKSYFEISEDEDNESALNKISAKLETLVAHDVVPVFVAYLSTLLALPLPDIYAQHVRYLDGLAMGHQVFRSLRTLMGHLAADQPLVLVLEDWHWADQSSADLLEHLLPLSQEARVLIFITARPEDRSRLVQLREAVKKANLVEYFHEISLTALTSLDGIQLAGHLFRDRPLGSSLREFLIRIAGGNPFFLEELIRTLIETEAVVWHQDLNEWRLPADLSALPIPATLQGVIVSRIDRLGGEAKQILKIASVVGRAFFYRVLRAVVAAGDEIELQLNELLSGDLIREKQRQPELEYIFKHALVAMSVFGEIERV